MTQTLNKVDGQWAIPASFPGGGEPGSEIQENS